MRAHRGCFNDWAHWHWNIFTDAWQGFGAGKAPSDRSALLEQCGGANSIGSAVCLPLFTRVVSDWLGLPLFGVDAIIDKLFAVQIGCRNLVPLGPIILVVAPFGLVPPLGQ